ncbi:MAG: hypothetical protein WDM87_13165 [Terracidiphilus sp.]
MRNVLLVARREYLEQIRGRAFRISTLLVPVLIVFLLGVSGYTGRKLAQSRHIAIAADNNELAGDIRDNLLSEKSDHFTIDTVAPFTPQDLADLRARLQNKSIDALLIIDNSASAAPEVTFESQSSADLIDTSRLSNAINAGFLNLRLTQQDYPSSKSTPSSNPFPLKPSRFPPAAKPARARAWDPFTRPVDDLPDDHADSPLWHGHGPLRH